jgi:hypothetical protein
VLKIAMDGMQIRCTIYIGTRWVGADLPMWRA